jgi:hypothetical protein
MINNFSRKNKRSKEKNLPVDNKVPKQQKNLPTIQDDVVGMPSGIIDINDSPDIATWNKKLHMKENASGMLTDEAADLSR